MVHFSPDSLTESTTQLFDLTSDQDFGAGQLADSFGREHHC
jgi:hypothetical protein